MSDLEPLLTPQELAELWKFDESTIRRMFQDEPGVLKKSQPALLKNRKLSPRVSLRIPRFCGQTGLRQAVEIGSRFRRWWSGTLGHLEESQVGLLPGPSHRKGFESLPLRHQMSFLGP